MNTFVINKPVQTTPTPPIATSYAANAEQRNSQNNPTGASFPMALMQFIESDGKVDVNSDEISAAAMSVNSYSPISLPSQLVEQIDDLRGLIAGVSETLQEGSLALTQGTVQQAELQRWLSEADEALTLKLITPTAADEQNVLFQNLEQLQQALVQITDAIQRPTNKSEWQQQQQLLQSLMPVPPLKGPVTASADASTDVQRQANGVLQVHAREVVGENPDFNLPSQHMQRAQANQQAELMMLNLKQGIPTNLLNMQEGELSAQAVGKLPIHSDEEAAVGLNLQTVDTGKGSHVAPPKSAPVLINAQQFAQDMSQHMLKHMKLTELNGISEARISLVPDSLGKVDVRIVMQHGQLIAQFMAETLMGKEMLENQLPQLRMALQNQGLQVEKLEVTQSSNSNMNAGFSQEHRQQSAQQQFTHTPKNKSFNYDQFAIEFNSEMDSISASGIAVHASSFDVTA